MNILGIGPLEWLVLFAIALVVVGPRRLPEVARTVGKWTRELRKVSRELRLTLEGELDDEDSRLRRREIRARREAALEKTENPPGPVTSASLEVPAPAEDSTT